jgi:hypothetical protein
MFSLLDDSFGFTVKVSVVGLLDAGVKVPLLKSLLNPSWLQLGLRFVLVQVRLTVLPAAAMLF